MASFDFKSHFKLLRNEFVDKYQQSSFTKYEKNYSLSHAAWKIIGNLVFFFTRLSVPSRYESTNSTLVLFRTPDNSPDRENHIKGVVSSSSTQSSEIPNTYELTLDFSGPTTHKNVTSGNTQRGRKLAW